MKKIFLSLTFILVFSLILTGCGNNNNDNNGNGKNNNGNNSEIPTFDLPWFGEIQIGSLSMNMFITSESIQKAGFVNNQDESTGDRFSWSLGTFATANKSVFEKHDIRPPWPHSSNVVLPKNITYNSTIDDVISAYGQPYRRYDGELLLLSNILVTELTYMYEDSNYIFTFTLSFYNETQKLYQIFFARNDLQ